MATGGAWPSPLPVIASTGGVCALSGAPPAPSRAAKMAAAANMPPALPLSSPPSGPSVLAPPGTWRGRSLLPLPLATAGMPRRSSKPGALPASFASVSPPGRRRPRRRPHCLVRRDVRLLHPPGAGAPRPAPHPPPGPLPHRRDGRRLHSLGAGAPRPAPHPPPYLAPHPPYQSGPPYHSRGKDPPGAGAPPPAPHPPHRFGRKGPWGAGAPTPPGRRTPCHPQR